jgi:hypothetical protein
VWRTHVGEGELHVSGDRIVIGERKYRYLFEKL